MQGADAGHWAALGRRYHEMLFEQDVFRRAERERALQGEVRAAAAASPEVAERWLAAALGGDDPRARWFAVFAAGLLAGALPRLEGPMLRAACAALADRRAKLDVAGALDALDAMPPALFWPMLKAAVDEPNPSAGRLFVEPCVWSFGRRRVVEALLTIVEEGDNRDKAGALRALAWAWGVDGRPRGAERLSRAAAAALAAAPAPARGGPEGDDDALHHLRGLLERWQCLLLKTFVENEDLEVRRNALPSLSVHEASYPAEFRPLLAEAIRIAREHPDEAIRRRIEEQLGPERRRPG
ncbi:MAG TPA: hypothetical protein VFS43_32630 [Polyangiaceae bacterium]|nr:hypothetical protein [Polyangiaceae bacterium]